MHRLLSVLASLALALPCLAQRSTPVQLLHPSGAANDQFGQTVAVDGDTMIVGAPFDDVGANSNQGSAHVYRWTGSTWAFEATLLAADGATGDSFGRSVALSGDTAVVGAPDDSFGNSFSRGSAYIFVRSGTTWSQQAKLSAVNGAELDQMGYSVALSGDTAIIGAPFDDFGPLVDSGSAYVFVRSGTTWTQQEQIFSNPTSSGDSLGLSVALSGDTAIVGASGTDVDSNSNQGAAYVFVRSATTWSQQARLTAADGAADDRFGFSVALSGDTAIVGAYADNASSGPNSFQGSAYTFVRSGTAWSQQAKLTASDGAPFDQFGISVALSRDTAVVGAFTDDVGANTNQGSAYVFTRSGTTWTQQAQLTAPDGAASDNFGFSVSISGDTVVVGANTDDIVANDQGSAWVFSRVGTKWIGPDLTLLASNGAAGDYFGYPVSVSGDTAVVGALTDDLGTNTDQGSAYVFVRSGPAWIQQATLSASDGAAFDYFGVSVALSGDTAIVGAYANDINANADQGAAYIFTRSGSTWTQQARLTASDGAANDFMGYSVALSGNTAFVGALYANIGANADQGAAYIFTRSGNTWTQQAKLTAPDGAAGDYFGYSVAVSGDTAIAGAYSNDFGANANRGAAYLFNRSGAAWSQQAKLSASDGAANDQFGSSVALSGDSALVGAPNDDIGANADQGSAYVFVRSAGNWSQQAKLFASDGAAGDQFGGSVALSGDAAVVGAPYDDAGANTDQGSAYLFARTGTAWSERTKLSAADGAASDLFGISVSLSGDTAFVGALFDNIAANADQGSARVFDVPANDFSFARNDSTGVSYPTLAGALLPAQSGHQLSAASAAFRTIGSFDTLGRSLGLVGLGSIRTPSTSTITLGGTSSLSVDPGNSIDIFGNLRVNAGDSADLAADSFRLGSRGGLTVRGAGSLAIDSLDSRLDGPARLEANTNLSFTGNASFLGASSALTGASISASGTLTNADAMTLNGTNITAGTIRNLGTLSMTNSFVSSPLTENLSTLNVFGATPFFGALLNRTGATTNFFGSAAVFGAVTNNFGATTTIRSGTLFVFGSFTNSGTIVGTVCSNCLQGGGAGADGGGDGAGGGAATTPGLDVGGDLSLGADANLNLPFTGAIFRVGGNYDASINNNARYDLASATLQLEGSGTEQTLEAMSKDLGASAAGLDRTLAGHYPIGTLEIGPSPSTVRLVDTRDNSGLGQSSCEAIYVGTLKINSGSRLINTGCSKIYYTTLINSGTIDVPANVIPLAAPCPGDLNADTIVDDADFQIFVVAYDILDCTDPAMPAGCPSDLNADAIVDDADFQVFVMAYNAVLCP